MTCRMKWDGCGDGRGVVGVERGNLSVQHSGAVGVNDRLSRWMMTKGDQEGLM